MFCPQTSPLGTRGKWMWNEVCKKTKQNKKINNPSQFTVPNKQILKRKPLSTRKSPTQRSVLPQEQLRVQMLGCHSAQLTAGPHWGCTRTGSTRGQLLHCSWPSPLLQLGTQGEGGCVRNGCGGLTFVPHADQWSAEQLVPSSWSELFERIWGEKIGKKNSASTLMVWLHSLFLQRHQTQIKEKVGNKTAGITAKKDFYINAHSSVPCHLTPISVSKSSIYKSTLY